MKESLYNKWMIWGIADLYFIVSVIAAILFGILSSDIQAQLHLNNAQLGFLGSVFFLSYGCAQFISGRLVDALGPRLTLASSAIIASAGLLLMSISHTYFIAMIAQMLIGIGFSTTYIGTIYLAGSWFSAERFPLISGITQMSANLMAAVVIIGIAVANTVQINFRIIFSYTALTVLCLAMLMAVIVRRSPLQLLATNAAAKHNTLWSDSYQLIRLPQYWYGTLYFSAGFSVLLAFSNLWNIPDQLAYGHSLQSAAIMNAMLPLGGALGAIFSGWLADRLRSRSRVAIIYSSGMLITTAILIYGPILSFPLTLMLLALQGFFFGGAVLGFSLVSEHIPATQQGTGFGLMATIAYLLSAILQYLVGILLADNTLQTGSLATLHEFKVALSPLVIVLAIGWIASQWLTDTTSLFKE